MEEMKKRLTDFAGTEGYDISEIMEMALSESPTVKEIRQSTDDLLLGVDIVEELMVSESEQPIIITNYTAGSVKLRIVALNPSARKAQEVPVKIYLPREATPNDILDMGDLEVNYDTAKSLFFVYKDKVTLAPKEARVFEVTLEDIWFVPDTNINELKDKTEIILEKLEKTPYLQSAQMVAGTIFGRLDLIAKTQADESVSKELHIGIYRTNLKVLEEIKEDIKKLERTLVAVGAPPAPEMLAESELNLDTPSRATTWFIIFAILIFIAVLGTVFFFTWRAQAHVATGLSSKIEGEIFPEAKSPNQRGDASPSD